VLGFSLALGFALPRLPRWGLLLPVASAAALLYVIAPQEFQFWQGYDGQFVSPTRFEEDLVSAAGHPDLPVVISDTHDFMRLQHYTNKSWQQRFVLLVDPEQAVVYSGSDTGDKGLAILRQYTNLPIYDFQPFLAEHPAFLLYSSKGRDRKRLVASPPETRWIQATNGFSVAHRAPRLLPPRHTRNALEHKLLREITLLLSGTNLRAFGGCFSELSDAESVIFRCVPKWEVKVSTDCPIRSFDSSLPMPEPDNAYFDCPNCWICTHSLERSACKLFVRSTSELSTQSTPRNREIHAVPLFDSGALT